MRWVFRPLARWSGIRSSRAVVRFAEQGWSLVYYSASPSLDEVVTLPRAGLTQEHFAPPYSLVLEYRTRKAETTSPPCFSSPGRASS